MRGHGDGRDASRCVRRPAAYVVTIVASLALCPLLGAGIVYGVAQALPATELLRQDPVMQATIMVETAVPSAINLLTLSMAHRHLQQSLSNLLFYQYLLATITLTAFVPLFLALVV